MHPVATGSTTICARDAAPGAVRDVLAERLGELLGELLPDLRRFALARTRMRSVAEDAVSETMLAALERPAAFDGRASLKTWLIGILKHKLVDEARVQRREQAAGHAGAGGDPDDPHEAALGHVLETAPLYDGATADPASQAARVRVRRHIERCVGELPRRQRQALLMRDVHELDTAPICHALRITANHLGVTLHRARGEMRRRLAACGVRGCALQ